MKDEPKQKSSQLAFGCLLLILLFIGWAIYSADRTIDQYEQKERRAAGLAPPTPEEALVRDVKINGEWRKGGFGTIAKWHVTLENTSKITTWKDLRYETTYRGESEKTLDTHAGEFNIALKPGQNRRIKDHNDGFIPQGAVRAAIRLTGGVFDTLASPKPKPTPKRP